MSNEKKAIVFAGGGSKGAYQLGAWKALNELGEEFSVATGTSIGSINAAFYVQKDFSEAEKMWNEVTAGDIMANGINFDVSFEGIVSQKDNIIPFLKNYLNSKSVDNTPFINMIHRYFKPEKFFSSEIDFALMTVLYKGMREDFTPVEIKKSDMAEKPEEAWKWISASCACFPVFPPAEIDGNHYIDGGFYDNIPIASAIKLGAQKVVCVDLNTENNHEGYLRHPDVTYIRPSKDLGSFLNFERNVLDRSIRLGYNDTMKTYGRCLGIKYTFLIDETGTLYVDMVTEKFIRILSTMEAEFDFSSKVRYQRVNKLEGCTSILGEYCKKYRPSHKELFIAAFELFLKACDYDDEAEYNIGELLYYLKTEADRIYPFLDMDVPSAFMKVKEFIKTFSKGRLPELKKHDEDRTMLILTSVVRALQQAGF
ncbi:MAG: patatin-like phospholipase family protein [Clostridia bacterium]|nr:patatin-like phospholipase family protein [Clostridia bacterium]